MTKTTSLHRAVWRTASNKGKSNGDCGRHWLHCWRKTQYPWNPFPCNLLPIWQPSCYWYPWTSDVDFIVACFEHSCIYNMLQICVITDKRVISCRIQCIITPDSMSPILKIIFVWLEHKTRYFEQFPQKQKNERTTLWLSCHILCLFFKR